MDDPTRIMRVQPIEARTIRSNPDIRRDEDAFAIDVDGHMGMEVYATLLSTLTGDMVYRRIY